MSEATDDVDRVLAEVAAVREKLLAERDDLLQKLRDVTVRLGRLDFHGQNARLRGIEVDQVGRHGLPLNTRDLIHAVATYYGYDVADLLGRARHKTVSTARHVAMYFVRESTRLSFPEIGREFDMRDHTTIISACASIAERKGYEADLATDLAEIARVLQEAMAKRAAPTVASEAV